MKPRKTNRLRRVAQTVCSLPFRREVLETAYRHFCESGELPEAQRLADAVVRWVISGQDEPPRSLRQPEYHGPRIAVVSDGTTARRPLPTIRDALLYEAVWATGICRKAARAVLVWEIGNGGDVTSREFLADHSYPEHNSVAMHLLGFPQRWAKRPFVAQAKRLFQRFRVLRGLIRQDEPGWQQPFADAILRFELTGELPRGGVVRDVALADAELSALIRHSRGADVRELMAAFDKAARAKGDKREAAIAAVQSLVRASRSPSNGATEAP